MSDHKAGSHKDLPGGMIDWSSEDAWMILILLALFWLSIAGGIIASIIYWTAVN